MKSYNYYLGLGSNIEHKENNLWRAIEMIGDIGFTRILGISNIYQTAKKHGAIGRKVCGAGGGGMMMFIVKDKEKFISEMKDLEYWDISPDNNGVEVKILTQ